MQLTRLDIKGFKSFADSVTINFHQGVTGVVGPNGCGKSNVVDSIRWVLGEQKTKSLRSDKMENIIFNGTRLRKPSSMAQVSLTFDNDRGILPAEYTQVTITRRYHRTGESEYLINDVRCRLKDIQNMLIDTGVGSDSYAIIELKKVDEILNDKDGSRRDLFEKSAGISKFKVRKKETLSKLDLVDKDLDRLGDFLFELEKNLKNIEKQARQAERYFALQTQYRTTSLQFAQKSLSQQKEVLDNLTNRIQNETQERDKIRTQIQEVEEAQENLKKNLALSEENLRVQQQHYQQHRQKIRQIENEGKIRQERLLFAQEKDQNIRQNLQKDLQNLQNLQNEIKLTTETLENAETSLMNLEDEVKSLQQNYDEQREITAEIKKQTQNKEQQYQAQQQYVFKFKQNYEIALNKVNEAKKTLETIRNSPQSLFDTTASSEEIAFAQTQVSTAQQHLTDLQRQEERRFVEIQELEQLLEKERNEINEAKRSYEAKQTEHRLTKSWADSLEGFPEALQYLQQQGWARNYPLLSDIVQAIPDYRVVIEQFLEPYLNYYVVQNEEQALDALFLLEKNKKGRANFWILDNVFENEEENPNFLEKNLKNPQENSQNSDRKSPNNDLGDDFSNAWFLGIDTNQNTENFSQNSPNNPQNSSNSLENSKKNAFSNENTKVIRALSVIKCAEEHQKLLNFLLKDVFIIEIDENLNNTQSNQNIQAEISQIVKTLPQNAGWILRNGTQSYRPFALNGGSVGATVGNRLGRAKVLEQLAGEIVLLQQEFQKKQENWQFKQQNLQDLKNNTTLRQALREANEQVRNLQNLLMQQKNKQEQMLLMAQNQEKTRLDWEKRLQNAEKEAEDYLPQLKESEQKLEEFRNLFTHQQEELAFAQENLQVQASQFNQKNTLFFQQKNLVQQHRQTLQFKEQSKEQTQQNITKNEQDRQKAEQDIENLLTETETTQESIDKLQEQTPLLERTVQELEENFNQNRQFLQNLEKNYKDYQRQRELQETIVYQLDAKKNDIQLSLAGLKERLWVEFQIEWEKLWEQELPPTEALEADLRGEMEDLRQKIQKMGTINPLAMEEYKELEERYNFTQQQKNDLESSKKDLLATITELETFATEAFMNAFNQIRENFIRVFRSLFSQEDKADLLLTNPQNPLESEIDIVAQPKGKRPLTIDQLSGGEKTLTAISLLFALYLLKPAPFCIFDEVDAPLDDTNTEKFNKIIQEFSKDSQFLIVTHNKRTMANTDVMYGVTMLQEGVSSVVPVDLREYA